ncbi:FAD:protein FMN transferase [Bradyrhizobium sp.]|jgi:thiamine biosynthesis lipoprotein|uniref:FAD:protein FMN transferase n=1 Tax=Bradyrhizobium sp. TaxID=376 RepID=UPI002CE097F3|nr:FAD:protein FMN transferase [Bradyrhizobium sp.]HWX64283.1 FAD:protein FMN transferase [Bradyrhizobium sp.]
MRRARPLLGTYVEIDAAGLAGPALERAIEAAFGAVARVHRLMSFHDPESDLSRLNRRAVAEPVAVDRWTAKVLAKARTLFDETCGLFDCAVGAELMRCGRLPSHGLGNIASGTFAAVEFMSDDRIRFSAPIAIDLGGIAKGFAVDRAIAALRAHGVREALVNAGGDLRVMGKTAQTIHIRCPGLDGRAIQAGLLRNAAIATSEAAATVVKQRARSASSQCAHHAYSVVASTCLLADALTKVLVQTEDPSAGYFSKFGAIAFVTSADALEDRVA